MYFQNAVGVTAATLNVSDTGAKPIMINGVTPQPGVIPPKSTVMLQYDGTNWNVISIQQLDLSFSPDYLFVDMGLPSGLMWAKRNIDVTTKFFFFLSASSSLVFGEKPKYKTKEW